MSFRNFLLTSALALSLSHVAPAAETLLQPSESPLVSFRILFRTGAAADPKGKEGAASLAASMLSQGGTAKRTYDQIVEQMFPMAASVGSQVDKEMTVFSGTTHVENLEAYYSTLKEMLLEPGWREDDFRRLKDDAINFLRIGLRGNNEEELGKETLYLTIYGPEHPYGHHNSGNVSALEAMTIGDLKDFYGSNYRSDNVIIAISGGYPADFPARVKADFETLAADAPGPVELPAPTAAKKTAVHILQKDTRSTLLSIGFPIDVTRSHPDWPALKLMQSYFGQHRSSKSLLFQQIREIRGMNYGNYAYIEYFPRGMYQFQPDANLARRQQIFQIWIRPVQPENGPFALKIALYELDKLIREGISEEDFQATKLFLSKNVNLLTQTQDDQLGYSLDSQYYGTGEFNSWFKGQLDGLTREAVNKAIKDHLRATDLDVIVTTQDAQGFRRRILANDARPAYASPPAEAVRAEDLLIRNYKLDLGAIEIVPADHVFE
ncbi:MAG: pitrilysin family protein [Acidobacteria bacterium]|nr:pitrilysin family protein [Acidobacteriota bacterium]MDA1234961.1 pitrilysin family protein [Acidobacteriota bacterium]